MDANAALRVVVLVLTNVDYIECVCVADFFFIYIITLLIVMNI